MANRVTTATIESAQRLLREGISHRQIADQLGVSRQTVAEISAGRLTTAMREQSSAAVVTRCPTCGYLVTPPCLFCTINPPEPESKATPLSPLSAGPQPVFAAA